MCQSCSWKQKPLGRNPVKIPSVCFHLRFSSCIPAIADPCPRLQKLPPQVRCLPSSPPFIANRMISWYHNHSIMVLWYHGNTMILWYQPQSRQLLSKKKDPGFNHIHSRFVEYISPNISHSMIMRRSNEDIEIVKCANCANPHWQ